MREMMCPSLSAKSALRREKAAIAFPPDEFPTMSHSGLIIKFRKLFNSENLPALSVLARDRRIALLACPRHRMIFRQSQPRRTDSRFCNYCSA